MKKFTLTFLLVVACSTSFATTQMSLFDIEAVNPENSKLTITNNCPKKHTVIVKKYEGQGCYNTDETITVKANGSDKLYLGPNKGCKYRITLASANVASKLTDGQPGITKELVISCTTANVGA